jgi:hypothetical protein
MEHVAALLEPIAVPFARRLLIGIFDRATDVEDRNRQSQRALERGSIRRVVDVGQEDRQPTHRFERPSVVVRFVPF